MGGSGEDTSSGVHSVTASSDCGDDFEFDPDNVDDHDEEDDCDYEANVREIKEVLEIMDSILHGLNVDAISLLFNDKDDQRLLRDLDNLRIVLGHRKRLRKAKVRRIRMDIDALHEELISTSLFSRAFRMERHHYEYLRECIREDITINPNQARRSTGGQEPISPDLIMKVALEQLAFGTSPFSVAINHGLSESSTNRVTEMFLDAIDSNTTCPELKIELPDPTDNCQLSELAGRWSEASTVYKIFDGTLGALDGWLPRTTMPVGVTNQSDYFSGHYQCYGLNIQAMCDPDLVFLYAAAAGPGKTNDNRAFHRCEGLNHWLQSLPPEYFIVADNAYPLSQKLLIPFSAGEARYEDHRTYNFYLSQLRIRIEMAFGLLTTKWRILRNALVFAPWKNTKIIRVCMKLHNFCIRMKHKDGGGRIGKLRGRVNINNFGIIPSTGDDAIGSRLFAFLPTHASDDDDTGNENAATDIWDTGNGTTTPEAAAAAADSDDAIDIAGTRRSSIVRDIHIREYTRPRHNILRNSDMNNDDDDIDEDNCTEEDGDDNGIEFYWQ